MCERVLGEVFRSSVDPSRDRDSAITSGSLKIN